MSNILSAGMVAIFLTLAGCGKFNESRTNTDSLYSENKKVTDFLSKAGECGTMKIEEFGKYEDAGLDFLSGDKLNEFKKDCGVE